MLVGRHKIGPYRCVVSLLRMGVCYYWRVFNRIVGAGLVPAHDNVTSYFIGN